MMRIYLMLLGLVLTGCKKEIPDFERTGFSINGQAFEILTVHGIFENYQREHESYTNFIRASEELIFEPVENEILENAEASFMINSIKFPYEPSDYLTRQIELLNSGESIEIIKDALYSITESLPGPDTKIVLLPTSPLLQESLEKYNMPGYGVAIGSGKIIIAINQTSKNWKEFLSYAIAHEYHHSTWISRNWVSSDFSLIEYLVFEGRADAFAVNLNDSMESPVTNFLSLHEETVVWDMIRSELDLKGHERIIKVMFGDDEIPYGSGYAIGSGIVRAFKKKHPDYSDLDIIDMEPERIFELSGYKN